MSEKTPGPVAVKVRAEARRRKISQAALAGAANLSQQAISRRFAGEVDISVTEAEQFAQVLGVSVSWLFGETAAPVLQDA